MLNPFIITFVSNSRIFTSHIVNAQQGVKIDLSGFIIPFTSHIVNAQLLIVLVDFIKIPNLHPT